MQHCMVAEMKVRQINGYKFHEVTVAGGSAIYKGAELMAASTSAGLWYRCRPMRPRDLQIVLGYIMRPGIQVQPITLLELNAMVGEL
jgi:hypothetical protein